VAAGATGGGATAGGAAVRAHPARASSAQAANRRSGANGAWDTRASRGRASKLATNAAVSGPACRPT
jgi:hypothetical protein